MRSRARAVLYATGAGMAVGCGAVFVFLGYQGYGLPVGDMGGAAGATALVLNGVPGVLLLGILFTGPSALLAVLPMAALMRRNASFGAAWWWGLAGTVAAAPVAWFFGAAFGERLFEWPSLHVTLLALGFACGLAGRWGYREIGDKAERNPSTTA